MRAWKWAIEKEGLETTVSKCEIQKEGIENEELENVA